MWNLQENLAYCTLMCSLTHQSHSHIHFIKCTIINPISLILSYIHSPHTQGFKVTLKAQKLLFSAFLQLFCKKLKVSWPSLRPAFNKSRLFLNWHRSSMGRLYLSKITSSKSILDCALLVIPCNLTACFTNYCAAIKLLYAICARGSCLLYLSTSILFTFIIHIQSHTFTSFTPPPPNPLLLLTLTVKKFILYKKFNYKHLVRLDAVKKGVSK